VVSFWAIIHAHIHQELPVPTLSPTWRLHLKHTGNETAPVIQISQLLIIIVVHTQRPHYADTRLDSTLAKCSQNTEQAVRFRYGT